MADPIQCSHRPPLGSSAPSIVSAAWGFSSTKYSNLQFRFQTCSESTLSFTIDVVLACSCHKYFLSWRNENCPKILRGHLYQYQACPSGQDLVATLSLIEVAKTFQHTLLAGIAQHPETESNKDSLKSPRSYNVVRTCQLLQALPWFHRHEKRRLLAFDFGDLRWVAVFTSIRIS